MLEGIRNKIQYFKELIIVMLAVLLVFQFIITLAYVPSGSMENTLNIGDRVIVNRLPYYYRDPVKGEIVIFKDDDVSYVKRVIAEPGDIIDFNKGQVLVNGQIIDEAHYLKENDATYAGFIDVPYTVPEDHYFVMGDNRMNSLDSRSTGAIHRDTIYARAGVRVYPFGEIGIIR